MVQFIASYHLIYNIKFHNTHIILPKTNNLHTYVTYRLGDRNVKRQFAYFVKYLMQLN